MFDFADKVSESDLHQNAVIKVVGVGGGGGNTIQHMLNTDLEGVDFICANTDAQALQKASTDHVLNIGINLTKGLGAGANPEIGRLAAQEDRDKIIAMLRGADMVFITAGMGGGTGTGAAPVVAEIAKELGILTVAVVTKPFAFEGKKRMNIAEQGLLQLGEHVDSLITIPNEKLLPVLGRKTSLLDAFKTVNDVLKGAVQGIADLIVRPGMINVDFADVKTVMSEMGMAMMGTGFANGEGRASIATQAAINSPLLEDIDLKGAKGILVNITAGLDLSLGEFSEVGDIVHEYASESATVVVGTVIDPDMSDEIKVTVVATGLNHQREYQAKKVSGSDMASVAASTASASKPSSPRSDSRSNIATRSTGSAPQHRAAQRSSSSDSAPSRSSAADDMDFLDVPAFLRRQAD